MERAIEEKILKDRNRFGVFEDKHIDVLRAILNTSNGQILLKTAVENPIFRCSQFHYLKYSCNINLNHDQISLTTRGSNYIQLYINNANRYIQEDKLEKMGFHWTGFHSTYSKDIRSNHFTKELLYIVNEIEMSKKISSTARTEIELLKEYLEDELK